MKECITCLKEKDEDWFRPGKNQCRSCVNKKLRERRKRTKNAATKRYEKTKSGFLMRLYRNMESRISGVQSQKHHLYRDKELLDREDFYKWAMASPSFHELFFSWEESDYERKLTPSVDRKNPSLGYSIPNMEWVTHSENSSRANRKTHES